MKRKIFIACAALVVSAAAVVGVKAYSSSTYSLLDANLEAIARNEGANIEFLYCFDASEKINSSANNSILDSADWYYLSECDEKTETTSPNPDKSGASKKNTYPCGYGNIYGTDLHFMGICY